jgi:hypothetical protein
MPQTGSDEYTYTRDQLAYLQSWLKNNAIGTALHQAIQDGIIEDDARAICGFWIDKCEMIKAGKDFVADWEKDSAAMGVTVRHVVEEQPLPTCIITGDL